MTDSNRDAAAATVVAGHSPAVAKAEAADAAGRHVEAVDQLAAAARGNDVEALTRLGKRLLVGDRAPNMPNDGARLLSEAAALGGAEAPSIVAVLYAVGLRSGRGLGDGLEQLRRSAERGFAPAQAQIRLLASASGADEPAGAGDEDWRGLAGRIDLADWQAPPKGSDLSESPRVCAVPDFVDESICHWLVEKAHGRLTRALVYEALSRKTTVSSTRTNTAATMNLLTTDFICALAQIRMAACVGLPFRQLEPISVLHYEAGQEITEHYDFVDPDVPNYEQEIATKGQRVVTFLIYLNDDYDGGETEFPKVGISHKGRCGDAVYFVNSLPDGSADVRTLHAGRPPANGVKWIVSQFMRDRATL